MSKKSLYKIFLILVIAGAIFLPPFIKHQRIKSRIRSLDRQIKRTKEEISRMEGEKKRLETDIIYVEKRARDKTGVAKKGEIILKPYSAKK